MSDWSPQQVIQGRYRLKSLLGKGGMGSVWIALHEQLQSEVAVKRLDPSIATNEEALGRFVREAQALAALRSPNVVQVFDYGVDDDVAFIAMELLRGESLGERIHRIGGPLPVDETIRFLGDVFRAIGKAHAAGIVHRDLKPDNVFICQDDPEFAKVLDFGVAKISSASQPGMSSQTRTGAVIGTPFYMSPEQARGQVIDLRSDLWSIGIIAFECLTGQLPFAGDTFGEILVAICTETPRIPSETASVPTGFDAWFQRATARDRELRFQTAREMWTELSKLTGSSMTARSLTIKSSVAGTFLSGERIAPAPGAFTTAQGAATYSTIQGSNTMSERNRRNLVRLGAVTGAAALLLVGGGFVWFNNIHSQPTPAASATLAPPANTVAQLVASTVAVTPAPSVSVTVVTTPSPSVEAVPPVVPARTAAPPVTVARRQPTVTAAAHAAAAAVKPPPAEAKPPPPAEKQEHGRELTRSFDR